MADFLEIGFVSQNDVVAAQRERAFANHRLQSAEEGNNPMKRKYPPVARSEMASRYMEILPEDQERFGGRRDGETDRRVVSEEPGDDIAAIQVRGRHCGAIAGDGRIVGLPRPGDGPRRAVLRDRIAP